MKQLQIKKVRLLQKMAERQRKANSLPWKRNFDMPQVPPPSRSPSKTNIIWVRVRNSAGEMEIDGFLRTKKGLEGLLSGSESTASTKIEVRVPREQDGSKKNSLTNDNDTIFDTDKVKCSEDVNTRLEQSNQDNCSALEDIDSVFDQRPKQNSIQQESFWPYQEDTLSSHFHSEANLELVPTVKGLKISPNEIRHILPKKQKPEERAKTEVYDQSKYSRGEIKTPRWRNSEGKRRNTVGNSLNIVSDHSNVGSSREKIGRDRNQDKSFRQKIRSVSSNTRSSRKRIESGRKRIRSGRKRIGSGRKGVKKVDRKNVGDDCNVKNKKQKNEQNAQTGGKDIKESKTKLHKENLRESRESSSTKISKEKSVSKFIESKPNDNEMCVCAKTLLITKKLKGNAANKPQNKKKEVTKPRSATRLNDEKSTTRLPKKSCSACTVKTLSKDDSLRASAKEIRSKSDTAACSKVREAVAIHERDGVMSSLDRKSHPPVPIILPSQSQLQNFDKEAKIRLRKALAVQMRRHCYIGTWAFQTMQVKESEIEKE